VRVYRVLAHDPTAAPTEPGGVLYIPPQGGGRADNPQTYKVRYVGDSPAGACAEAFNYGAYRQIWSEGMLRGIPALPNSRRVLAWYDLPDTLLPICDLDDPNELLAQELRPSTVITRDYQVSQAWALRLFDAHRWSGVRWWSYHDARWASMAIWDYLLVAQHGVEELTLRHPALQEAAHVLQIRFKPEGHMPRASGTVRRLRRP
jgi:hypothetical protein